MCLAPSRNDRLERFPPPEPWRADVSEACGVPVEPGARRRLSSLNRARDGVDVARLRIDVERGRIVLTIAMMLSASEGDQLVQPSLRPAS